MRSRKYTLQMLSKFNEINMDINRHRRSLSNGILHTYTDREKYPVVHGAVYERTSIHNTVEPNNQFTV